MKKLILLISGVLLFTFLFSSCAVNRRISYDIINTEISTDKSVTYSIATHDQRIEVTDGSRNEKFVGYMRSGVAIAFPLETVSRNNFTDDFSNVISNSLKELNNRTHIIKTNYTDSKEKILKNLIDTKSDRLLLITITKWRTDSKPNGMLYATEVIWDLSLEIFDSNGKLLASNRTEGMDPDLDKGMSGSVKRIQKIVNEKFKEKIDLLFNDPNIKNVMNVK